MCLSMPGLKQLGCVLALLCSPGWLFAQTQTYTVTEFTNPPGGYVVGGNNLHEYVGNTLTATPSAIFWKTPATPIALIPPTGSAVSSTSAINDAGQIVGLSVINPASPTIFHATLWEDNSAKDLGVPPGYMNSRAAAINSTGQVAGSGNSATAVDIEGMPVQHALLFSAGTIADLGTLGGSDSAATGINSAGQIAGWSEIPSTGNPPSHATLWKGTVPTDLGTLGGANSSGLAINDAGAVVGEADLAGLNPLTNRTITHATIWKDGVATDLGTLGSGTLSVALAVNSTGDTVGESDFLQNTDSKANGFHAVLWSNGQIIDLNSVLPTSLQAQVLLEYAQTIADDGSIVVEAQDQAAVGVSSCCSRTFLLTPIAPLTVSCPSATAQTATAYSSAAIASGGVPPYTYSTAGTLAPGLTLAPGSGVISGTPTTAGTFNFTIHATDASSGTATHACTITVAPRPDFLLEATPDALKLNPGVSGSVVISASASNGFAGAVVLSVSRAPAGASLALQATSISGAQTSTLTIDAGSAAAGIYPILITGTSGGLTHSINVTLTIAAGPKLNVSPTSLSFDSVHHYAIKFKEIEITNSGTTPASIGEPHVKGSEEARDSFVPISLCGRVLEPDHSCRIVVIFIAERLGRLSATLEIPTKGASPLMVALNAEVIALRR
jgi:probable HAF family extracellular repeat protein